jgi:S-formylglutathione hydrolase
MRQILLPLVLFTISICNISAQQKGTLIIDTIDAPSIASNMIGEPAQQPVAVYLPPSYYNEPNKHYPVIYFLPGYEDTLAAYLRGFIDSYFLDKSMNSNITQGRSKEVIMVIVNGYNLLKGSFYHNSPVTGNWEDFVVKEAVKYMDDTTEPYQKPSPEL